MTYISATFRANLTACYANVSSLLGVINSSTRTSGNIVKIIVGEFTRLGVELCEVGSRFVCGHFDVVGFCDFKKLLCAPRSLCLFDHFGLQVFHSSFSFIKIFCFLFLGFHLFIHKTLQKVR